MQLTKDDVKRLMNLAQETFDDKDNIKDSDTLDRLYKTKYIDLSKFQQVVTFYDHCIVHKNKITVEEREKYEQLYSLWIAKVLAQEQIEDFDKWLFNYCFKDGLK